MAEVLRKSQGILDVPIRLAKTTERPFDRRSKCVGTDRGIVPHVEERVMLVPLRII